MGREDLLIKYTKEREKFRGKIVRVDYWYERKSDSCVSVRVLWEGCTGDEHKDVDVDTGLWTEGNKRLGPRLVQERVDAITFQEGWSETLGDYCRVERFTFSLVKNFAR